jgi:hypothetical protein
MKDAQYYHVISENLIDGEIRQASENEFARVWLAAGSAEFWIRSDFAGCGEWKARPCAQSLARRVPLCNRRCE